jgi:hypothetical protein
MGHGSHVRKGTEEETVVYALADQILPTLGDSGSFIETKVSHMEQVGT